MSIPQRRMKSATPVDWKRAFSFAFLFFLIQRSASQESFGFQDNLSTEEIRPIITESATPFNRMSIANMTCKVFEQPLNHFVPRGRSPVYEERYCTYDGFVISKKEESADKSPIFFYTGNESPLEQYINQSRQSHFLVMCTNGYASLLTVNGYCTMHQQSQTGLMWELAPKFGARVVFAEHRYEGESLPPKNLSVDCLSYASTMQALADYARLLEEELNPNNVAPVIVFGGSYGGMLSAWMRMKYPHLVTGAIAASAPIGAFPQSANTKIDYSARVLSQGLKLPYPPTATIERNDGMQEAVTLRRKGRRLDGKGATSESGTNKNSNLGQSDDGNHCVENLLAAWPLITWLARQDDDKSASLLQKSFSMCDPLPDKNGNSLLQWAQGVWFDLAEGSFPYPSSYIPFALLHKKVNLPSWPTQDACWKSSNLHKDWGVRFDGNKEDVNYTIDYGNSGIRLKVDWNKVELVGSPNGDSSANVSTIDDSTDIVGLLTSVKDAVSIWYNITKDVQCYNISQSAPNSRMMRHQRIRRERFLPSSVSENVDYDLSLESQRPEYFRFDPAKKCREAMLEQGSWGPLCCNDEMNLVITEARGMGNDFFWPPTHPKSIKTYQDMIANATFEACPDPYGIYGYSREPYEPLSKRLDTYYGGISMKSHSNIIFSNGLLDPWSAGGVYKDNNNPSTFHDFLREDKVSIENITENDVIAMIIPFGGHHTDLMYSSSSDPKCVTEGRDIEETYIAKWIQGW